MRGSDARSQTVAKSNARTLIVNQKIGTSQVLRKFCDVPMSGPEGPPRNSVTAIADIVMTFMNSARKKMMKATTVRGQYASLTMVCQLVPYCSLNTISCVDNVFA